MNTYYSTFNSGCTSVVEKALKEKIPDVNVTKLLDGLAVYQTELPSQEIEALPFF